MLKKIQFRLLRHVYHSLSWVAWRVPYWAPQPIRHLRRYQFADLNFLLGVLLTDIRRQQQGIQHETQFG